MSEESKNKSKKFVPFEKANSLEQLKLFFVIVPYGQSQAIQKYLDASNVAASFIVSGDGTGSKDTYELLGLSDSKKQIIFTLVRADETEKLKEKLHERFSISNASKGIAFSIRISSIAGVSVYKFLTNSRVIKGVKNHGKQK